jgi:hypothetical protein
MATKTYWKDENGWYVKDGETAIAQVTKTEPDEFTTSYTVTNMVEMPGSGLTEIDEEEYNDVFVSVDSVGSRPDIPPQ